MGKCWGIIGSKRPAIAAFRKAVALATALALTACNQVGGKTAGKNTDSNTTVNTNTALSLASAYVITSGTRTFTASGGTPAYRYSVIPGTAGGSIDPVTGLYTATASAGTDTIKVVDAVGATVTASVVVGATLTMAGQSVVKSGTVTFAAVGGTGSYTYSVQAGGLGGTINSSTGLYTAPAIAGIDSIKVVDSMGNTAVATATVNASVSLNNYSVMIGTSRTLTATGGTGPFTYAVVAGGAGGSIGAGTGVYTAPGAIGSGSDTIKVTDTANGNTATGTVTLKATLTVTGGQASVLTSQSTAAFTETGGVSGYSWSVNAGGAGGTINSVSGVYTAPAAVGSGTDTIKVTDSLGNTATTTITVLPALGVNPGKSTLFFGATTTLTGVGGTAPYTFTITSGGGSITGGNIYNAPISGAAGSVTIQVKDNTNATATTTITTKAITQWVGAGGFFGCRVSAGTTPGQLQCWGYNNRGQLGDGTNTDSTTIENIDGGNLYMGVTAGGNHACAIQQTGTLLCWGYNAEGEVGDNTLISRAGPVLVNDNNAYSYVSAGTHHTCGITTGGTLRCWGGNDKGQLGDGTNNTSKSPESIDIANTYSMVSAGFKHTCAITTAGVLKCWGDNTNGQVGDGSQTDSNSPEIINAGVTYKSVAAGWQHTCAVTTAGVMKCWGSDSNGQLGDGAAAGLSMIPKVVNAGTIYSSAAVSSTTSCGILAAGTSKCWGNNANGQVGSNNNGGGNITTATLTVPVTATNFVQIMGGASDITATDVAASGGLFFQSIGTNSGTGAKLWSGWGRNGAQEESVPGTATNPILQPTANADP
jgi:alpha-tubulin suppressor-like RCC1 family protein